MPLHYRQFLLALKRGEPNWALLGLPGAEGLPAGLWRLQNLAKMDKEKLSDLLHDCKKYCG